MNFPTCLLRRALALAATGFIAAGAQAADALKLDVYNPGKQAIFPVSSVLVSGQREAILVDAQFGKREAQQVVEKIRASGKKLTTIYISHGDPDYYFGLDTIHAAYPDAKIVATPQTVAHIRETVEGKLAYWGPKLGDNAPAVTIVPEVLKGRSLTLEGRKLDIMGLDSPQPERSFVWIPSIKAVVGGVVVDGKMHVWIADTQSLKSRKDWLGTLNRIEKLKPKVVVPGHFSEGAPLDIESVRFTRDYLKAFDEEAAKAADSTALIAAMQQRYPELGDSASLELSAKVIKGEMKWP
ncbi:MULTISPECIES: MBL fold metallo-hydrolase [unclassified Herbaspirillum]|uniref:MBL fold metallo-hydrolase n=1 Tax=unclassified Herbaspirillum TaxID=2624150 RepID=UPI0011510808|nr:MULTISPECIES: MBL fold metallo-hydrolase [unclassified Herbaspirillum]MBB5389956.1 glyoxylase-like metal-dependent hydrolase (beta-lactamase superfamily II) [Herbaspirillum sp. SJZ102]TQK09534.1 glyoxylase-like metal-dependent hydrolase (beta-lactamase superfamily II) [Herbaspirillum sp. SJZ130]TQK13779.1 glyoxylase-like metal-dependent hydrolase (beta-lactamase superfamily II) [Herbaspirillum sp. SJZ106]